MTGRNNAEEIANMTEYEVENLDKWIRETYPQMELSEILPQYIAERGDFGAYENDETSVEEFAISNDEDFSLPVPRDFSKYLTDACKYLSDKTGEKIWYGSALMFGSRTYDVGYHIRCDFAYIGTVYFEAYGLSSRFQANKGHAKLISEFISYFSDGRIKDYDMRLEYGKMKNPKNR